ncbi:MAG: hypothetical protein IPM39_23500 [Chloroflexi bacterium]|nr:hypothetical protein [Chloroflexota bacterium]
MKAALVRNSSEYAETIPYYVELEVLTRTVDAGSVFRIPVGVVYQGGGKRFTIDVCGFQRQSDKPAELPKIAGYLVNSLVHLARLPSYVFIARRAGEIYPVYTIDNEVFATTPGGPIFKHVELAKVREYLGDYLNTIGILGENGVSDRLHVRGVNLQTLGLRRPVFYLKKRVVGQTDFWAPVFEAGDGQSVYTYAASARREAPVAGGQEVLALQAVVAEALMADGRLADPHDLRPDRLFPDYWKRLETTLTPQGSTAVNRFTLPLYSSPDVWVGLEPRPEEERYSLFIGEDAQAVVERAAADFARRGYAVASELVMA